jgi:SAM-dependent methyltransferase
LPVDDARRYWDEQAATFDEEPDHGLRDPSARRAWTKLLLAWLPAAPARVTDLGCGTGTLAVLMAAAGFEVRGLDLSDRMVAAARAKAERERVALEVRQGDAALPPYADASTDVVIARHVLWALPDPEDALRRWTRMLRPGGRLVLIEGRWSTGSGIAASDCRELVLQHRREAIVELLQDPVLWGRVIDDERYVLLSWN